MSRLRDPRLWFSLASLVLVLVLVVQLTARTAPGPLSPTHAAVDGLAGLEGCVACHGAATAGSEMACGTCHGPVLAEVESGTGFHGALEDGVRCARCHGEHHGAAVALVDDRVFARAGIPARLEFDHAGLDFALGGVHADLDCEACHVHAEVAFLAPGQQRYRGLDSSCSTCHEDPHRGDYGQDCARCHGEREPFERVAAFRHTEAFPLRGVHGGLACADCHGSDGPHSLAALARSRGVEPLVPRSCAACHEAPHGSDFLERSLAALGAELAAAAADPARGTDATCAACHPATVGGFGSASTLPADPAWHGRTTGMELSGPHLLDCAECHSGTGFAQRFPGRDADDCASCHGDPHGGQFEALAGEARAAACTDCHRSEQFVPSRLAEADHAREVHGALGFALDGGHADLACNACHGAPPGSEVVRFRGTPAGCASCHADPHGEAFLAGGGASDCASCHVTASFAAVRPGAFDHGAWTGFPLEGAHARAACTTCHVLGDPEPGGRRHLGRVADLVARPEVPAAEVGRTWAQDCARCHGDPHGGAFRGRDGASPSCWTCHGTGTFAGAETGFDHGLWTGHELEGPHADLSCSACHRSGEAPPQAALSALLPGLRDRPWPGTGPLRRAGPPEDCATCHADPHGAAFERLPAGLARVDRPAGSTVACSECHLGRHGTFAAARERLDHGAWTGFVLEGAHAPLACVACHEPAADGRVHGPAPGASCADCHGDPHGGQFRVDGRDDCARCHSAGADFAPDRFDHDATRFALEGVHAGLECAACHRPTPTLSGRVLVRYRPLGTRCVDCHGLGEGGEDGR